MKRTSQPTAPACSRATQAGFSLVEMVVVAAIMMCLIVVALPTTMQMVANVRTRSTMSNVAGFVQRTRSEAIRQNKAITMHYGTTGGEVDAFIVDAASTETQASATDPQLAIGNAITLYRFGTLPSGTGTPTEFTSTILWGSSDTAPPPEAGDVSFNSRGLPCKYAAGPPVTCTPNGFVYYFTYQPPFGTNGWAALSVSPAGRVKTWLWDGSAWKD